MHRVNLSLAVVCMVNTTHSGTTESQYTNSALDARQKENSSFARIHVPRTNVSHANEMSYTVKDDNDTFSIEKDAASESCGSIISEQENVR